MRRTRAGPAAKRASSLSYTPLEGAGNGNIPQERASAYEELRSTAAGGLDSMVGGDEPDPRGLTRRPQRRDGRHPRGQAVLRSTARRATAADALAARIRVPRRSAAARWPAHRGLEPQHL